MKTEAEIRVAGMQALIGALGLAETERFLMAVSREAFDYTGWRRHHFLTLCARLLALGDYLAQEALAAQQSELKGIYAGNPKRGTARPTTERMLAAFEGIDLFVLPGAAGTQCFLSQLSDVQERILALLGLSRSLFTDLQTN